MVLKILTESRQFIPLKKVNLNGNFHFHDFKIFKTLVLNKVFRRHKTAYILVYTDHFQNSHLEKLFQNLEIMEVKFTLYNYHFEV